MAKIDISIIIPVFNEEKNVQLLYKELLSVVKKTKQSWEIIFVDDGSTDNTLKNLRKLKGIKIIQLRKNFGQTAAIKAGVENSKGKIIITLDGDLQNNPHDIPQLLKKMKSDKLDVVSGWREKRYDPFLKKFFSLGANFLRHLLVDDVVHDSGCTLKAFKRECFDEIDLIGDMHRFLPAILKWKGFKIGEIKVSHRRRKYGKSKYNWKRLLKGVVDLINVWFWYKFSSRPLHLFGGTGLMLIIAGAFLLLFLAGGRALGFFSLANRVWPLVAFFSILAGIQLFASGILADILIKNYFSQTNKRKIYSIKKIFKS